MMLTKQKLLDAVIKNAKFIAKNTSLIGDLTGAINHLTDVVRSLGNNVDRVVTELNVELGLMEARIQMLESDTVHGE